MTLCPQVSSPLSHARTTTREVAIAQVNVRMLRADRHMLESISTHQPFRILYSPEKHKNRAHPTYPKHKQACLWIRCCRRVVLLFLHQLLRGLRVWMVCPQNLFPNSESPSEAIPEKAWPPSDNKRGGGVRKCRLADKTGNRKLHHLHKNRLLSARFDAYWLPQTRHLILVVKFVFRPGVSR